MASWACWTARPISSAVSASLLLFFFRSSLSFSSFDNAVQQDYKQNKQRSRIPSIPKCVSLSHIRYCTKSSASTTCTCGAQCAPESPSPSTVVSTATPPSSTANVHHMPNAIGYGYVPRAVRIQADGPSIQGPQKVGERPVPASGLSSQARPFT